MGFENRMFYLPQIVTNLDSHIVHSEGDNGPFMPEYSLLASQGTDTTLQTSKLIQVSESHKRSFIHPGLIMWRRFDGQLCGHRRIKGTNVSDIKIEQDSSNPLFGLRVYGLRDSTGIETSRLVAEKLNQADLPTERQVEVRKLEKIKTRKGWVPVDEWKVLEIKHYEEIYGEDNKFAAKIRGYLNSNDFYVEIIDGIFPPRIADLRSAMFKSEVESLLSSSFSWLNVHSHITKEGLIKGTPCPKQFDIKSDEDLKDFLYYSFETLGTYVSRMHHSLNLVHKYLNELNIALAMPVDLDSVSEMSEGPEGLKEIKRDNDDVMVAIDRLFSERNDSYISQIATTDEACRAFYSFVKGYLYESFREEIITSPDPTLTLRQLEHRCFNISSYSYFYRRSAQEMLIEDLEKI